MSARWHSASRNSTKVRARDRCRACKKEVATAGAPVRARDRCRACKKVRARDCCRACKKEVAAAGAAVAAAAACLPGDQHSCGCGVASSRGSIPSKALLLLLLLHRLIVGGGVFPWCAHSSTLSMLHAGLALAPSPCRRSTRGGMHLLRVWCTPQWAANSTFLPHVRRASLLVVQDTCPSATDMVALGVLPSGQGVHMNACEHVSL